jgi:C-terminal processing protease CtpA/Prc
MIMTTGGSRHMPFFLMLACASAGALGPTILYREDGEVVTCPAESREAHDACVRSYKSVGFRYMPAAYWGVGLGKAPPLRVALVAADSPAAASGIVTGDVLLELDGRPVRRVTDVLAIVDEKRPGDTLRATLEREGTAISVESVLAERPRHEARGAP